MDRQIVYAGQILPETTLLQMTKDAMIGLAKLSAAVLGTSTVVNGFAVTPTSPASLQVNVAPGEIYSLQNIDSTAFSSLAADTTHQIMKQGIALDATTLTLAAPATSGQSINYLIQAAYADTDAAPVVLPYYNSTNTLAQNTNRKGTVVLTAKAGVPAATGSQSTPAPDSGNVGLYVVTVAYGQTQIVAGNISQYAAAPFINMPTMAQIQAQAGTAFAAGGTAPAYTLTPSPAIQGYADKQRFNVTFAAAGTPGSNSINVNGLGAIPLKQYAADGSLVSGIVTAGMNSDVQIVGAGSYALLLDPLPAQMGSYAGRQLLNGTQTLTASQAGMLLYGNSNTAFTVTLPQANTLPTSPQLAYYFYNYASGPMTIATSGTDVIGFKNGTVGTTIVLAQGDSLAICAYGSGNAYLAVSGTATLQYSPAFLSAVAAASSSTPTRSNLAISYTGTSGVVSTTANALTLQNGSGAAITLTGWSQSATSGNTSGVVNSLDTGSWAFSTLYNLFAIYNPTTATRGLLWSLSATAPTLPSGYTYFSRIGANFTQSAASYYFLAGTQCNDEFFVKVGASGNRTSLQLLSGGTSAQGSVSTPTWVSVALSSYIPPTASKVLLMCNCSGFNNGQSMVAPNANYGAYGSVSNPAPISLQTPSSSTQVLNMQGELALESTSIYWAQTGNFYLWMRGWKDSL